MKMEESRASIADRTIVSLAAQAPLSVYAKRVNPETAYRQAIKAESKPVNLRYPWEDDIPEGAVAVHPVYGDVSWDSRWRFSTKSFIEDLKAAEGNPAFVGHIILIDSGGGECFGCHEAFEVVRDLQKPCIAVIDTLCASAAYWIACAADRIYASSMFSIVGSIGIMGVFHNYDKFYEQMGITIREYYSSYSDLKNKMSRDAQEGKAEQYITEILDPIAKQFLSDVRSVRDIPEDSEAMRGMEYLAAFCPDGLLIDRLGTLEDAVAEILASRQTPEIDLNTINLF